MIDSKKKTIIAVSASAAAFAIAAGVFLATHKRDGEVEVTPDVTSATAPATMPETEADYPSRMSRMNLPRNSRSLVL